ncbi:hydrogenase expression/formation protein HypE [Clostridium sp. ZBS15]|uniref:hydrogenase expression/formation protein HypE n=1 Tax=Clostridium sp. ZBS15 TaxID=2949969 RepID=UPI00207AAEF7|nr:hydrogenase expression/formation protein HypE [Clostridium sp. ZBS15]
MGIITLAHGSGGEETNKLIENIFIKYFNTEELKKQNDSAILNELNGKIAVTTDSFVVNPIFFKGGDIGKLSICGTVNDLAVSGSTPLYITAGFIIEEGFEIENLEKVVKSMTITAKEAKVKIVAGDTKVVEKGRGHKIYINTTGIGVIESYGYILKGSNVEVGDKIILSGTIGEHGMCIINEREKLSVESNIISDCAALNILTKEIIKCTKEIKIMRDPTRGGLANTLNELVNISGKSMKIYKRDIPITEEVRSFCDLLGFDPLYVANEGKLICIVSKNEAEKVLRVMKSNVLGKDSAIIGEVIEDDRKYLYIETDLGSTKILKMAQGELLPRIC